MAPPTKSQPNPPDSAGAVEILQFTDLHLYADAEQTLLGITTLQSFQDCLELARQSHWPPDLMLLTGDLVHDGSTAGYQRLQRRLGDCGVPVHVLPGNHDDPRHMCAHLSGGGFNPVNHVIADDWQIILLDSSIADSEAGHLADNQLAFLDECLTTHPRHYALVCLHHPPVVVGSAWLDHLKLENSAAFLGILDRHPQVRGVLCGHIHQEFYAARNGVRLIGSPSTCIQFRPDSQEFALDLRPPGFRRLRLDGNGGIATEVVRLERMPAGLDLRSLGY